MPNFNLSIETLSPVHVGNGGLYDGMTSIEHRGKFIPLDARTLYPALKSVNIDWKQFVQWIEDTKHERDYRKPQIGDFMKTRHPGKVNQLMNALSDAGAVQLENLSLMRIYTDIATCIKDLNTRPYLPGSELKGAIITTLMFDWLQHDENFKRELKQILETHRDFLTEVYQSLLQIKQLTEKKKSLGFQNYRKIGIPASMERDFRRILTMRERSIAAIADDLKQKLQLPEDRVEEIVELIETWRNGDKREYKNRIRNEQRKYDKKRINSIVRELDQLEEKYWNTYLSLSPEKEAKQHKLMRFLQISDTNSPTQSKVTHCLIVHREPRITMDLFFEVIDTNFRFKAACNIDRNDLIIQNIGFKNEHAAILNKEQIASRIYTFSRRIIQDDMNYFDSLKGMNYRFPLNEVKAHLKELMSLNSKDSPLLRIGKGQGFMSLTLALLIRDYDREIYQKLLGVVQSDKNNPDNFPVTRRLFVDGTGKYKLPGWLKLTFEEVTA